MSREPRPDELAAAITRHEERERLQRLHDMSEQIMVTLSDSLDVSERAQLPPDILSHLQETLRRVVFVHFWTGRKLRGE